MIVKTFEKEHISKAKDLVLNNYITQQDIIPTLPKTVQIPELDIFAENSLGVVAIDGDRLLGFIGCYGPIDNLFGTSNGIYSPLHANATIAENRDKIYSQLYQRAAQNWVNQDLLSHSITFYTRDTVAIESFFNNGFGNRCVDGIRDLSSIDAINSMDIVCEEISISQLDIIYSMQKELDNHFIYSPMFMPISIPTLEEFIEDVEDGDRYFVAKHNNELVAFIKISVDGETFISQHSSMLNICGAYLKKEYRGKDIFQVLFNHIIRIIKDEGYTRLGVDYEKFNPTARGFWEKYFTPYTYSLTRRIDERIVELYKTKGLKLF